MGEGERKGRGEKGEQDTQIESVNWEEDKRTKFGVKLGVRVECVGGALCTVLHWCPWREDPWRRREVGGIKASWPLVTGQLCQRFPCLELGLGQ